MSRTGHPTNSGMICINRMWLYTGINFEQQKFADDSSSMELVGWPVLQMFSVSVQSWYKFNLMTFTTNL